MLLDTSVIFIIPILLGSMILGFFAVQIFRKSRVYRYFYDNVLSENPAFYKRIGTDYVRNLIRFTPLKYFNQRIHINTKRVDKGILLDLKREMTDAEFGHAVGFVTIWIVAGFLYHFKVTGLTIFILSLLNILFNLYPIFIQQSNKLRINRLLKRLK